MKSITGEELHQRLVAEIVEATGSVLSTMLGMEVEARPGVTGAPGPGPLGGVSAMVGLVGPWIGAGAVSCNGKMACRLASQMLMREYDTVNEDVLDAVGEVTNMIVGNIKTNLESTLGDLSLGIPTVTFGEHFATRSLAKETWTLVPFGAGSEELYVQVLLIESSRIGNADGLLPLRVLVTMVG